MGLQGAGTGRGSTGPGGWGTSRPAVSVVTLAWNAARMTDEFLTAVRGTLQAGDEVVVVDNASHDETPAVLARHDWVRVIRNDRNEGFAGGCNIGAAAARNPVVVFVNNDTLPTPGWVERLVAPLADAAVGATGPVSNMVSGLQLLQDPDYRPTSYAQVVAQAEKVAREAAGQVTVTHRLVGFCLALRRDVFVALGGFDTRFGLGGCEDDDLCWRIRFAGLRLLVVHEAFVHHVGHASFDANAVAWHDLQTDNVRRLQEKLEALPIVSVCLLADGDPAAFAETLVQVADLLAPVSFDVVVLARDVAALQPVLAQVSGVTVVEVGDRDEGAAWWIGRLAGRGHRRALIRAGEAVDGRALVDLLQTDPTIAEATHVGAPVDAGVRAA